MTLQRETESTSYNDVLRNLLGLGDPTPSIGDDTSQTSYGLVMRNIAFPEGTEFRVTYKGMTYTASVKGGRWVDSEGHVRRSPSEAANAITGNNVNGWRFWEAKRPGDKHWVKLTQVRSV